MALYLRKKILLIEDDMQLGSQFQGALQALGHDVFLEGDGGVAQGRLDVEPFDLVITEIRLPSVRGIEILHSLKGKSNTPVILMGMPADVKSEQEALELGASAFLQKPVDPNVLSAKAIEILKANDPFMMEPGQLLDPEYCRVRLEDLFTSEVMKFAVYVRINDSKFLKIAHDATGLSQDRLVSLKTRGVEFLYLKKDDFARYVGFAAQAGQQGIQNTDIERTKRIEIAQRTAALVYENFHFNEITKSDYDEAQSIIQNSITLLSSTQDAMDMLAKIGSHDNGIYSHSVGVSFCSGMICRALGWTSAITLMKVSMGGLLHDIGKKDLSKDLLEKPRIYMTDQEVKLYETHPQRGVDTLVGLAQLGKSIGADVLQIILQHHEMSDGSGFPQKLRSAEIFPLAKVVCLANVFCNLVVKNPNSPGCSPFEALDRINNSMKDKFDASIVKALNKVFGRDFTTTIQKKR